LAYSIQWHDKALDDLQHFDKPIAVRIISKVQETLSQDPIRLGKPLRGQFKGLYRYRIGDYRVIYRVDQGTVIIFVVRVGHRREIYDK